MISRAQFEAEVLRNDDPQKRGRLIVKCNAISDEADGLADWVEPAFPAAGPGHGWFFVPQIGDMVLLEVVTGSSRDERPNMGFLRHPSYRWMASLYETASAVPDEFQTDYSKRFGYKSPGGLVLMFDDVNAKILIGSALAAENFVLGQVFKKYEQDLLDAIVAHTHATGTGPSGPPLNATTFTALKSSPIADEAILSDRIFGEK